MCIYFDEKATTYNHCPADLQHIVFANKNKRKPIFKGWYADPEAIIFGDTYLIYPTYSAHAEVSDSSAVLTDWQKNERKNSLFPKNQAVRLRIIWVNHSSIRLPTVRNPSISLSTTIRMENITSFMVVGGIVTLCRSKTISPD